MSKSLNTDIIKQSYRVFSSDTKINLSKTSYTILFEKNQYLLFDECAFQFSDKEIMLKLTIDGIVIFNDLKLESLDEMVGLIENNYPLSSLSYNSTKKIFKFNPKTLLRCQKSFKIEAKKTDSDSMEMKRYVVTMAVI